MKRAAGLLVAAALVLTGCSAGPSRDAVVERFSIELSAALGVDAASVVADQASALTDAALDEGKCGDEEYRSTMIEPSLYLLVPWDATCSMYFEGDMTPAQIERARQTVADAAMEHMENG